MPSILTESYERSITQSYAELRHDLGMKYREFGARFGQACREANLSDTQADLAKIFMVSAAMISYYKTGKKLPSMETALLIATKTGVCVEWLLSGRGPKHPPPSVESSDWLDLRGVDDAVKFALQAAAKAGKAKIG